MRTFVLLGGFATGALSGAWLGLIAVVLLGFVASDTSLWEDLLAAAASSVILGAGSRLVYRFGGGSALGGLLFAAVFAAWNVFAASEVFGAWGAEGPPLAFFAPCALVALPLVIAAVREASRLKKGTVALASIIVVVVTIAGAGLGPV